MNNKFTIIFLTTCILTAQADQPTIQTGLPKITVATPTAEEIENNRRQTEFFYRSSKNMRFEAMYATLSSILSIAQQDARFVKPEILNNTRFDLALMYQDGLGIIKDYEKAQNLYEQIIVDPNATQAMIERAQEHLAICNNLMRSENLYNQADKLFKKENKTSAIIDQIVTLLTQISDLAKENKSFVPETITNETLTRLLIMANMYQLGNNVQQDKQKALEVYTMVNEHPQASNQIKRAATTQIARITRGN